MKSHTLPVTPEKLLAGLRFSTETDTVERGQQSAKEAVFYSHVAENCFDLYERRAFTKGNHFTLGGMYLRGAVAPLDAQEGCEVATEFGRAAQNIRYDIVCAILLLLSVIGTVLSGNLFETMLPVLALFAAGYLIADAVAALFQVRRLKKEWSMILSTFQAGK